MPAPEDNQNAITHGVYSARERGELPESRQTPELIARQQEIAANLATVEGVEREQERLTASALLSVEIAQSWVREKRAEGIPLDKIPIFKALPGFQNSAGRLNASLLQMKREAGKLGPDMVDAALGALDGQEN